VGVYYRYSGKYIGVGVKLRRVITRYIYYGFYCFRRVFVGIDSSYLFYIDFTRVLFYLTTLLMPKVGSLLEEVSIRRRVVTVV